MSHRVCRLQAGSLLLAALLLGDTALTHAQVGIGVQVLTNGSFESDGEPSLAGWQPGNPNLASVVSPGAPGGGDWALQLVADWIPTLGFVRQRIEGLQDGDIVELRADVKAVGQEGGGSILLLVGDSPWSARAKWAASSSETWTTLSVLDTLELAPGDSVWVQLSSFGTEIMPRVGLFDSASLVVLEQVPSGAVSLPAGRVRVRAYPNPSNPSVTIGYEIPRAGRAAVRIYDTEGRLVRVVTDAFHPAGPYRAVWDGRGDHGVLLGSGVYFVRVDLANERATAKIVLVQ